MCHHQRSKKTFRNYFLVNKSNYMHFYEYFRLELFCRKLNLELTCHHKGSKKTFRIQFLVHKSESMGFYELFYTNMNFELTYYQQRSKKKPFEFFVWSISRFLYNFIKIFGQNFFVGNRTSNKRVNTRRPKTSFKMR